MQRFCWKEFGMFDYSGGASLCGSFPRELRLLDAVEKHSLAYLYSPSDLTFIPPGFEKEKCTTPS